MTDVSMSQDEEAPKKAKKGLVIGVLGAVLLGGTAFFVTYTGIFPSADGDSEVATESRGAPDDDGHGVPVERDDGRAPDEESEQARAQRGCSHSST